MIDLIAVVFLVAGAGFLAISAIGLIRFPDFWTRAHAVAKAETLGLVLVFIGLIVLNRLGPGSLQLGLIAAFSLLVNPTAIHALARSAVHRPEDLDIHPTEGHDHALEVEVPIEVEEALELAEALEAEESSEP